MILTKHTMCLLDSTVWKWTDGSTLKDGDYSYWTPGEPNSHDDQQFCAQLWYTGDGAHDGQWDDTKCTNALRFLCHKPKGKTFSPSCRLMYPFSNKIYTWTQKFS